jgi:transposase-like protein
MLCPECKIPQYCVNGKNVNGKWVQVFQCPKCKRTEIKETQMEG